MSLLLWMGWWTWLQSNGSYGFYRYLDGDAMDGEPFVLSLGVVHEIHEDHWTVERGTLPVRVEGQREGLEIGQVVTLTGTWRASDHTVLADEVVGHPDRGAKRRLGIAGLLFVLGMLPVFVRLEEGEWVLRG